MATKTATKSTKATKKATKTERQPRARKEGLRKPQIRILACLAKAKAPVNQDWISDKAPVDKAWVSDNLYGRIGDANGKGLSTVTPLGKAQEAKQGYKSLLGLGYVRCKVIDVDGKSERVWEITAAGRKAFEKLD